MSLRLVAPPLSPKTAKRVVLDELDWIFDGADEITGCRAPYEMDAHREAVKAIRKAVKAALADLPKRKLEALGRKLFEIADARDAEVAQLEVEYERDHG